MCMLEFCLFCSNSLKFVRKMKKIKKEKKILCWLQHIMKQEKPC